MKIGGETIRSIPFQSAAAAITMSIHQIAQGKPPASLMRPEFASDRETIKTLGEEVRKQIEDDKNPDPKTVEKLLAAIHAAEIKADSILPGIPATAMRPIGTSRPFTASSPCSKRPRSTSSSQASRITPTRRWASCSTS